MSERRIWVSSFQTRGRNTLLGDVRRIPDCRVSKTNEGISNKEADGARNMAKHMELGTDRIGEEEDGMGEEDDRME